MLAIDHGRPKLLSLKDALHCFIEHRREVILRRTRYLLAAAEKRAETLEGYLIALDNLDDFIKIIRDSSNRDEARTRLVEFNFTRRTVEQLGILIRSDARLTGGRYHFSEQQADAVLELRLYQLTGLERDKVIKEYRDLVDTINDLMEILAKEERVRKIMKDELKAIRDKYATERRTELMPEEGEIALEDLIPDDECVITITHVGYIKRTAQNQYRAQRRGGVGVKGMTTREAVSEEEPGDFVEHMFTATMHDYLMFFTRTGRCYVERVHSIVEGSRNAKGRSIANFLELRADEKIAAIIRIKSRSNAGKDETWDPNQHVVFATRSGIVKKSNLSDFSNIRKGGIIAIQIEKDDCLIDAKLTLGQDEIVLITRQGMSLRFHEEELRDQGRNTVGVWGIRPEAGDFVVALAIVDMDTMLLVASENALGKRTSFQEYRVQTRGGKGIITMKTGDKTGEVINALCVKDGDEAMLISNKGQMTRIRVSEIRETGRNAQGVKLMDLRLGEKLQDIARVVSRDPDETEAPEAE
jgi:DNA gyrase subunit A